MMTKQKSYTYDETKNMIIHFGNPEEIPFGIFSNYYNSPISLIDIFSDQYLREQFKKKMGKQQEIVFPEQQANKKVDEVFQSVMNYVGYNLLKTPQYKMMIKNMNPMMIKNELSILLKNEYQNEIYKSFQIAIENKFSLKNPKYIELLKNTNKNFIYYNENVYEIGSRYELALMFKRRELALKNPEYYHMLKKASTNEIVGKYTLWEQLKELNTLVSLNELEKVKNEIKNFSNSLQFSNFLLSKYNIPKIKFDTELLIKNFFSGSLDPNFYPMFFFPNLMFDYQLPEILKKMQLIVKNQITLIFNRLKINVNFLDLLNPKSKYFYKNPNIQSVLNMSDENFVYFQKYILNYPTEQQISQAINIKEKLFKDPSIVELKKNYLETLNKNKNKQNDEKTIYFFKKYLGLDQGFQKKNLKTIDIISTIDDYLNGIGGINYYDSNNLINRKEPIYFIDVNHPLSPYAPGNFYVEDKIFPNIMTYTIFHLYQFFLKLKKDDIYKSFINDQNGFYNTEDLFKRFLEQKHEYDQKIYKSSLIKMLNVKFQKKMAKDILILSGNKKLINLESMDENTNYTGIYLELLRSKFKEQNNIQKFANNYPNVTDSSIKSGQLLSINDNLQWFTSDLFWNFISERINEFSVVYENIDIFSKKDPEFVFEQLPLNESIKKIIKVFFNSKDEKCLLSGFPPTENFRNKFQTTNFNDPKTIKTLWNYFINFICTFTNMIDVNEKKQIFYWEWHFKSYLIWSRWKIVLLNDSLIKENFSQNRFHNSILLAITIVYKKITDFFGDSSLKISNNLFTLIITILLNKPIQIIEFNFEKEYIFNEECEISKINDNFFIEENTLNLFENMNFVELSSLLIEDEEDPVDGGKSFLNIVDESFFEKSGFSYGNSFEKTGNDDEITIYEEEGSFQPKFQNFNIEYKNYLERNFPEMENVNVFINYSDYLVKLIEKLKMSMVLKKYYINRQIFSSGFTFSELIKTFDA